MFLLVLWLLTLCGFTSLPPPQKNKIKIKIMFDLSVICKHMIGKTKMLMKLLLPGNN